MSIDDEWDEGTQAILDLIRELQTEMRAGFVRIEGKRASAATPASASGAVFPNYGRRKGESVSGAAVADLEYYATGCIRSIKDPAKQRFHAKERVLLDSINEELARNNGGTHEPPPSGDPDDIPF